MPVIPAPSGCTKCCTGPSGVTCTPMAQSPDNTETLPCASCLSELKAVRYYSIIEQAQSAGNMEQMIRLRCSCSPPAAATARQCRQEATPVQQWGPWPPLHQHPPAATPPSSGPPRCKEVGLSVMRDLQHRCVRAKMHIYDFTW